MTMPDWLRDSVQNSEQLPLEPILVRVGLSIIFGFLVAGVYLLSQGRRKGETATLPTTLVLLSVLIALVTMVIGNSVARAFGLVGALSIVRFRTVVEDTRDTAFVIFAVVVGMAAGSGYTMVAAIGVPAVAVAALAMQKLNGVAEPRSGPATLVVRIGLGHDPKTLLGPVFANHVSETNLTAIATARQGAAIDYTYAIHLNKTDGAIALMADLNRTEGVQNVEFRQQ